MCFCIHCYTCDGDLLDYWIENHRSPRNKHGMIHLISFPACLFLFKCRIPIGVHLNSLGAFREANMNGIYFFHNLISYIRLNVIQLKCIDSFWIVTILQCKPVNCQPNNIWIFFRFFYSFQFNHRTVSWNIFLQFHTNFSPETINFIYFFFCILQFHFPIISYRCFHFSLNRFAIDSSLSG